MPFEIIFLKSVSSTNDYAKDLALKGKSNIAVVSEEQTSGRGRFDRDWDSQSGGLYLSILLSETDVSNSHILTLAASLAVHKVVSDRLGANAKVKWPNDVYVNDKKICGILTEIVSGKEHFVIVGIGLNANQEIFSEDLRNPATSLFLESKKQFEIGELAKEIVQHFEFYYSQYKKNNFKEIIDEWKTHSLTLGKKITLKTLKEEFSGKAIDVNEEGHLILERSDGSKEIIVEGDILV